MHDVCVCVRVCVLCVCVCDLTGKEAAGVGVPIDSSYLGGDCESNLARWGTGACV